MRYAILGDIHSNLGALETVLLDIDRVGVDRILSVGDVVGYGAAPSECIAVLRERGIAAVQGNHDAACVGTLDDISFNRYAREAVRWTRSALGDEDLAWLAALPLTLTLDHCQLAHGSINDPDLFEYVRTPRDADPSLDVLERPIGFVGHTHIPIALLRLREPKGRTAYAEIGQVDLTWADHCLANVGSVGQPRDADHRTGWVLYDSEAMRLEGHRLEYDVEREAARIRGAGLPRVLADRLFLGV